MRLRKALLTYRIAIAVLACTLAVAGCKSAPPSDTDINTALQKKLTGDSALAAEPIQSFVQSGVAVLQGSVSSEAAKALAASDASQVTGVKSVVNQLTVQTIQAAQPAQTTQATQPAPPMPPPPPAHPSKPAAALVQKPAPQPARQQARNEPPPPPQQEEPPPQPAPIERRTPPPPPPQALPQPSFRNVTVPSGTTIPIRITQTLDSATAQPGDNFSGSVAHDVLIDGVVAIPAGTNVSGRVEEVHEASHFKGSSLLSISLVSLNRRGEHTPITTEPYTQQGKGRGTNTAEKVGGGAAVGAILGSIFGGGKGAAIGALAGGGVGAGAQGVTRGQQVQIPSETLLRFNLASPIQVRASTVPVSEGDANLRTRDSN